uniref:CSON000315 protein n=1 Tax=Culicoides sonorensis TaxID=179676 RepID=A0A336MII2_CULSO
MSQFKFYHIQALILILILNCNPVKLTTGLEKNCDNTNIECLSSLTQSDCDENEVLVDQIDENGCVTCPYCDNSGLEICMKCNSDSECAHGLICDEKRKFCAFNASSCHHLAHMKKDPQLKWKPKCYANGMYKEKQCRGDKVSGRCFCFNEVGQKIFGWDWRYNEAEMTCACSRHRSKLEANNHLSTLHCQQNGNYEELQCDSGVCFCVEPKTGQLQLGTKVLPDNLWTKLPCYNRTLHGDTYLRQCESMAVVQKKVDKLFELHGTKDAPLDMANCNYDGSYGLHKMQGNEVKCIWRDGKIISPYSGDLSIINLIDCACAIDQQIYEASKIPFKLTCNSHGNYQAVQYQNEKYYCVDALGYAVSDFETNKLTEEICNTRRYDKITTESYC